MSNALSQWETEVRWAECDAAGIVYHARVLDWFSEARVLWLSEHDLDYYEVLRSRGIELLVKSAEIAFRRAMKPKDAIRVDVSVSQVTPTRATFSYQVWSRRHTTWQVTAMGVTEHAFVVEERAARLDRVWPELYALFQQGVVSRTAFPPSLKTPIVEP
jgi:acyl-CoA thioester hydrolase